MLAELGHLLKILICTAGVFGGFAVGVIGVWIAPWVVPLGWVPPFLYYIPMFLLFSLPFVCAGLGWALAYGFCRLWQDAGAESYG